MASTAAKVAAGVGVVAVIALIAGGKGGKKVPDLNIPAEPKEPPVEPPPPPPGPKHLCNYVGCPGYNWPHRDMFPNEGSFLQALANIGYISLPPGTSVISGAAMSIVRQFQRDYNVARKNQTVEAVPIGLATDGLIGKHTITALIKARQWVSVLNLSWFDIVALGT